MSPYFTSCPWNGIQGTLGFGISLPTKNPNLGHACYMCIITVRGNDLKICYAHSTDETLSNE